nr:cytochrome c oxidase subunit 3 [Limobrevibacterium gyesilva]
MIFLAVIAGIVFWWLSQQRLMAKPWLEEGPTGGFPATAPSSLPAAKIGLGVFLAVVGSLFSLLISAYFMRLSIAQLTRTDTGLLPTPNLLWLNTGVLVLSSVALHWAQVAARRGEMDNVRAGLLLGGVSAFTFLAGQLMVWQQLSAAGYFLASNPANSFFYLITGVHGLHVAGGLVALGRTGAKAWRGIAAVRLRLSVELCAMYWHFLLLVWLILFSLLTGWAGDFVDVCRALLT